MRKFISLLALFNLTACATHHAILASDIKVKVSREEPTGKCKTIGQLTGSTATAQGTQEQALEDLKTQAANKGANYVMIKQFSDYGTAVTGVAYDCY